MLAALLVWTGVGAPALGAPGPLDILSLPPDVDMALCVRGAAEASHQPWGRAARQMSDELSGRLGLPSAWGELWKTLDLPAAEAIDQLLGRRVLIAWRWPAESPAQDTAVRPERDPDWVVLSLITESTERRIRERLRPAPRDIQDGQAILSLEDGRFLLTSRLLGPRRASGERLAILMLAPAAHISLFKDMLPRLGEHGPLASLRDDPTLAGLDELLSGDLAMLTAGRRSAGDPAGAREASAIGAWWRRGEALDSRGPGIDGKLIRTGAFAMAGDAAGAGGGSIGLAPGQIDRLSAGALVAIAELLPRQAGIGGAANSDTRGGVAFTVPHGPSLGSMVAGMVALLGLSPDDTARALGSETIALIQGSGMHDDPLSLTLGISARDVSLLAPTADRLMATVLSAPATATGPGTGAGLATASGSRAGSGGAIEGPDFGGAYPPAVRVADVPANSMARLGGLLGDSPVIAWQFAPMQGATPAPRADGAPKPSPWAVPGWWVVRLAQPADAAGSPGDLRETARVLTSEQDTRGIVSAGVLRPADMLVALAAVDVPVPPVATIGLRWIDRVRWEGSVASPGRLVVEISLDLNPTRGATPP